jgi:3-phosphoshikimate 1-carboxyvinyltransferase
MSDVTIAPLRTPLRASMTPPGSKSLTNRALVLAALADGVSTLSNVLFADDTRVMLDCLRMLGFNLTADEAAQTVRVCGRGGTIPASTAELFCGNSGTTIRFLTALCALGPGGAHYTLDGIPRMRQRPIGQLAEMLRNLGSRITFLDAGGFPPIEVLPHGLPGGILPFESRQSSQFLSAVLQVAPYAKHEVQVDLRGKQTSWPYVAMTMRLMDVFGVTPHVVYPAPRKPGSPLPPSSGDPQQIVVQKGSYAATDYAIEPDASNASYFLAIAAIHPSASVTIEGLGKSSLQGDIAFADLLHRMGADLLFGPNFITVIGAKTLEGIDADMLAMPDMAQTLAVVALFAHGPTRLRGLHTLRLKETDRVAALATELGKFGASVDVNGDTMTITPPPMLRPAEVDTYDDHRMAMSFAVAGTKLAGVVIKDAECVNKTYPAFFTDLARLGEARSDR